MFGLSDPHGGVLVNRVVTQGEVSALERRAARLPQLVLDGRELADLELIATGAASPLTGFMGHRDYESVLRRLRLSNGTPWPVPFTLAVTLPELASALQAGAAALRDGRGRLRGTIAVTDTFVRSAREEAAALYGTHDPAHPGVRYLLSRPTGVIGGPVVVLPSPELDGRAAPRDIRATARRRRWLGVTGLATAEGMGCIEGTGDAEGVLVGTRPVALRHAPGRDALLQALVLKNHGAQEVFLEHERGDWLRAVSRLDGEDLGVTPFLVGTRTAEGSVAAAIA